jgi:plastocyanin
VIPSTMVIYQKTISLLFLSCVLAGWISGCGDRELGVDSLPSCPSVCITIKDMSPDDSEDHFEPAGATVVAGTTVFWNYSGFDSHQLRFSSVDQQGNATPRFDLDDCPIFNLTSRCSKTLEPGTYQFSCTVHSLSGPGRLTVEEP